MPTNQKILSSLELANWTAQELPVRFFGDPILYETCTPFETAEFGQPEMTKLAAELTRILTAYREHTGMGRGLAANQIGSSQRMVAIWLGEKIQCLVNPKALALDGRGSGWECCISSNTLLIGEVIRPWTGMFEYFSLDGKQHELAADPAQTRLLLHEIDHLDGNICTDKYEPRTTAFVTGGKAQIMSHELTELLVH